MHDPLTVAFEFRPLGITIWHVDPEKGGDDNSCDWHGSRRPLNSAEKAILEAVENLESTLDNRPHYDETHPTREHRDFQELKAAVWKWRKRSKWRLPVRWHFWHWRLQISVVLDMKRWLFSRCCKCGGRFAFGEAPCSGDWNGVGPRWFRGEPHVYHSSCDDSRKMPNAAAEAP